MSREVALNGGCDAYRATFAQRASKARACRPKVRKLVAVPRLAAVVDAGLTTRWSPAEVSARLVVDYPGDLEMRVSAETIYCSLYLQGKGGLKKELVRALRTGRLKRRPRKRGERAQRANVLGDIAPISERPAEAADRAFPGHWEGDLIMGAFNRSALVTVVERRSRFLLLGDLPAGHDAQAVYECLIELTADLPDALRRSLTPRYGRDATVPRLVTASTDATAESARARIIQVLVGHLSPSHSGSMSWNPLAGEMFFVGSALPPVRSKGPTPAPPQ